MKQSTFAEAGALVETPQGNNRPWGSVPRRTQLRRVSLSALTIALATMSSNQALAQQTSGAGVTRGTGVQEGGAQPDIIVTAQRREQRLQDVPVPVTALGTADLQARGATDFNTYLRQTPSAYFNDGASQGSEVKLRGVGNGTAQLSPTTAVYLGEVPVVHTGRSINSSYNFALIDLERVEILRGPQGQLFGANSLGGAIRNIPNPVRLDALAISGSASGSSTAHARGNYAFDGTINLPLSDTFGIRVTAYTSRQSGWYTNVYNGGPVLSSLARNLPLPPPVLARVPGGLLSRIVAANPTIGAYSAPAVHESNDQTVTGGRGIIRWHPSDGLDVNLLLAYERKQYDGPGWAVDVPSAPGSFPNTIASSPFPVPYASSARRYQYSDSARVDTHDQIYLANLVIDYDLPFAKLTSSTAYWERKEQLNTNIGPISGLVTGVADSFPLVALRTDHPKSYSQELRLTSRPDPRFNWLAGVFVQRIDQRFSQALGDQSNLDIYYNYTVLQNQFLGLPAPTTKTPSLQDSHFIDDQEAIYGQLSYSPVENLTGDLSFRAFNLHQEATADQSGFSFVGPGHFTDRNTTKVFTPKLNVSWKAGRDKLLYATVSKGYRTGIINFPVPTPACSVALTALGADPGAQNVPPTKPDTVWNYEIGAKTSFANRAVQINASLYHIDWNNLQTQVVLASLTPGGVAGGCTSLQVANVGNAKIDGAEVEMNVNVSRNFRIETSFSYNHSRYASNVPTLNVTSGTPIEGTPDLQAFTALQYGFDIGPRRGYLRAEWSYTGKIHNIPLDFVTTRAPFSTGDFSEVNLRAGADISKNVDIALFVTNLFDEFGVTRQLNQRDGAPATVFTTRPRTVGATLRAHF